MLRYRLRTLLILLLILPPLLAGGYYCWGQYAAWRGEILREHETRQRLMRDFVPPPLEPLPPREGDVGVYH